MLRFVFLTGFTKFSQASISSELNNITNVSMRDDYAGICGITKEELLTQMSEDIDALAEAQGIAREEAIHKLKENYDGYHLVGGTVFRRARKCGEDTAPECWTRTLRLNVRRDAAPPNKKNTGKPTV